MSSRTAFWITASILAGTIFILIVTGARLAPVLACLAFLVLLIGLEFLGDRE